MINVYTFDKTRLAENTYLIVDVMTGDKAIIDPSYRGEDLLALIGDAASLKYFILTHGHGDHMQVLPWYQTEFKDALLVVSEQEKTLIQEATSQGARFMEDNTPIGEPDIRISDGQIFKLGETALKFLHTPGHSEGSMCILADNYLFSGDTLFYHSVGATHFPTGNQNDLFDSIKNKLFKLSSEIKVMPGHGEPTTIAEELANNPYIL